MANNRNAHGSLPQPAPDGATSMAAQSPVVQRIQALGHAPSYYEATIIADEVRAEADRQHEAELFAQNREAVMSLATMAADTLTEAMSTIASMSPGRSQAASPTVVRNLASELGSIIAEQDEILAMSSVSKRQLAFRLAIHRRRLLAKMARVCARRYGLFLCLACVELNCSYLLAHFC